MRFFHKNRRLQLKKFLSITLSISMILLGVPVKSFAAGTVPLLRDTGDAGGHPLFDCNEMQETIDRINRDLPNWNKTIDKQQAMIDAAKEGRQDAYRDAVNEAQDRTIKLLTDLPAQNLRMIQKLNRITDKIEKLKLAKKIKISEKMTNNIKNLEHLTHDLSKGIDKVSTGVADYSDVQTYRLLEKKELEAQNVKRLLDQIMKDSVESGLAEDLGDLIKDLGGPLGIIIFDVGGLAINVGAKLGEGMINDRDLAKFEESQKIMEDQRGLLKKHLDELKNDLKYATGSGYCLNSPKKKVSKVTTPPPSATEPPSTTNLDPTPVKSSGGSGAGIVVLGVLLGGAAIAGVVAAGSAVGNASTTTSNGGGGGGGNTCSGSYYWYNSHCTSSACASFFGGLYNSSTGPFCTYSDCVAWATTYNVVTSGCSSTASYTKRTETPNNGCCAQQGSDF